MAYLRESWSARDEICRRPQAKRDADRIQQGRIQVTGNPRRKTLLRHLGKERPVTRGSRTLTTEASATRLRCNKELVVAVSEFGTGPISVRLTRQTSRSLHDRDAVGLRAN